MPPRLFTLSQRDSGPLEKLVNWFCDTMLAVFICGGLESMTAFLKGLILRSDVILRKKLGPALVVVEIECPKFDEGVVLRAQRIRDVEQL